ncbi:MAG: hypothetical protein KDD45_10140, partial [Bdellovibrionales bacterium]|nr:hypothetical protein [Bdellovibrionales bacterium]
HTDEAASVAIPSLPHSKMKGPSALDESAWGLFLTLPSSFLALSINLQRCSSQRISLVCENTQLQ